MPFTFLCKYNIAFTGYYSCTKCHVKGKSILHRVSFLSCRDRLRRDDEFRVLKDKKHHKGKSILTDIPGFFPVTHVPLDYMHLICLGVTRKLLHLWTSGIFKLPAEAIAELSRRLENLKTRMPLEFQRRFRPICYLKFYKATELRTFLLYTGPVVLLGLLTDNAYDNFISLHIAIRILCSPSKCIKFNTYAKNLLLYFVETFASNYDEYLVSHNIHNVIHLPDDVLQFGNLDNFSAFPQENYMQLLKKIVQSGSLPLQQLSHRLAERALMKTRSTSVDQQNQVVTCSYQHTQGPRLNMEGKEFLQAKTSKWTLKAKSLADGYCIVEKGKFLKIENIVNVNGVVKIVGKVFLSKIEFYSKENVSSTLNVWKLKDLSPTLQVWDVAQIKNKCFVLECFNNEIVGFPLLHNES